MKTQEQTLLKNRGNCYLHHTTVSFDSGQFKVFLNCSVKLYFNSYISLKLQCTDCNFSSLQYMIENLFATFICLFCHECIILTLFLSHVGVQSYSSNETMWQHQHLLLSCTQGQIGLCNQLFRSPLSCIIYPLPWKNL